MRANDHRRGGRRTRAALAGLFAALLACWPAAGPARAEAAFANLVVRVPETVIAGQPFIAAFRLQNRGEARNYIRAVFTIPRQVLLAAPPPDGCFAAFDRDGHRLVFEGPFAAGWSGECRLELAAAPDFTNVATFSLEATVPPDRYTREEARAEIADPLAPVLFSAAGIGVTRTGAVVLVYFAVAAAAVSAGWRRRRAGRKRHFAYAQAMSPVAAIACVGFLHMFAVLAWEDWRTLADFKETRCQVLDSTVKLEATGSSRDTLFGGQGRIDTYSHMPVFSVRYEFDGRTMQSLGFSTGSRLSYSPGAIMTLMENMERRSAAGGVPCWVDSQAPQTVVLLRGFGGAYIFAVLPVLVLALMGWMGLLRRPWL